MRYRVGLQPAGFIKVLRHAADRPELLDPVAAAPGPATRLPPPVRRGDPLQGARAVAEDFGAPRRIRRPCRASWLSSHSGRGALRRTARLLAAFPDRDKHLALLLAVAGFRSPLLGLLAQGNLAVERLDGVPAIPAQCVADLVDHRAFALPVAVRIRSPTALQILLPARFAHDPG